MLSLRMSILEITMITNNSDENLPIIENMLEPLAQEYFPEFIQQTVLSSDDTPGLSEDDFNQVLKNGINLFKEPMFLDNPEPDFDGSPRFCPLNSLYQEPFDVYAIRKDFPILNEQVNGRDLIWFDNAATTQKPRKVIERIKYFYEHENSNVHRAAHTLAARTTGAYECARQKIADFLNAPDDKTIVFVRGATEAINLVAHTYGLQNLSEGDEVLVSQLEHHANIVPWQIVCARTGAKIKVIPVDDKGQLILSDLEKLLNSKTKIVAVTHVSNALGTITPIQEIVNMAHRFGAKVLVDGAQALAHLKVDVQTLDCDFYAFSGHKIFGPTGIGALYGKPELLESMQPYQGGGSMISDVTFENTSYKSIPHKFEAGTGSIADAIGLGSAIDYVSKIGLDSIYEHEHQLLEYAREAMKQIPGLTLIGNAAQRTSILSFIIKGLNPEMVGKALNEEGIAVRAGHHCSQPILRRFGLESTVRASLAFYNTHEEIDFFIDVLRKITNRY